MRLRPVVFVSLLIVAAGAASAMRAEEPVWLDGYRDPAARLIAEAVSNTFAWQRLALLTDTFGHRLSGSTSLERAIEWAAAEMKRDGLENVHTERVIVPKWVRGRERAQMLEPARHELAMLGLGGSVGTPADGIQAEVVTVRTFTELDARAQDVRGRIVLFNAAFTTYNDTVVYRSDGPSSAARYGAVAVLVRSVGPPGLRLPHTGMLSYSPTAPRIPAAAIATEDADLIQRIADRGERIVVRLQMEARHEGDVESANVVGEVRGRERPDEIVVVGGHLDSWDVGTGATDDGGGCIVTWEALRLMKKLGLRPRRTVRVVLWTNEENGVRGGTAYADLHRDELARHVLMLESDYGVMRPIGFGFTGNDRARQTVTAIATLLKGIGVDTIGPIGGGADIEPSMRAGNVPGMSLDTADGDYFLYHHTAADTVDKIDPAEIAKSAAAVAVMAYIVADLPQRLGR